MFTFTSTSALLTVLLHRYSNILPYDRTRVTLSRRDGRQAESTYINASWVSEPVSSSHNAPPRRWIAAQAPLDHTIHDFLSMFLEPPVTIQSEGTDTTMHSALAPRIMIMLTACTESGREKSARYWPTRVGETASFAYHTPVPVTSRRHEPSMQSGTLQSIDLTFVASSVSSETDAKRKRGWRTNRLRLRSSDRSAEIDHVEFLGWQDHGIPDAPEDLLSLLRHISQLRSAHDPSTPIVVHCSAGVGRTGSLIAVSSLISLHEAMRDSSLSTVLDRLRDKSAESPLGPLSSPTPGSKSDMSSLAKKLTGSDGHAPAENDALDAVAVVIDCLREQRTMMVQTDGQVQYVYDCIAAWHKEQR